MIRLGLRLTLNGGKEAAIRLIITIAAVAIGVGLLLIALAGMNAINAQNARSAWLNTGMRLGPGGPATNVSSTGRSDPLWWLFSTDAFGHQEIDEIDVAPTGPGSPVPPGLTKLPGPGQYYASPALGRLLHSVPASELGDRFSGTQVGTIGAAGLPAPNSLIMVVGQTAAQLSHEGASEVTSINTDTHLGGIVGWDAHKLQVILAVGALALLFPVLIFIGTATRLSAARREQRFAAMRLVGATPRQVSVISAVEASVAALGGVAVGFGLFFLIRPALSQVAFTGEPFASGDLSLSPTDILLAVVGVPLLAALAARVAMRRVQISPLGVTRRVTPKPPRAYRVLPLAVGIAELIYFVNVGHPRSTGGQIEAYFSGCLLIMAGLVIAGPWLTMVGSRILARRAARPAVLIAGRRLSDNPRAAFRSISGLIIALFATSVSVGVISTIKADHNTSGGGPGASHTLFEEFMGFAGPLSVPAQTPAAPTVSAAVVDELRSISGVRGVTLIHSLTAAEGGQPGTREFLAACDQLAHTPSFGRCPAGASVVALAGNLDALIGGNSGSLAHRVWPAASISQQQLQQLPVRAIVVGTNGSRVTIETARTALEVAFPGSGPVTLAEINTADNRTITELQQMTNVVILASLVIAGCSLAVSVTGGINDRRRPFSLLRLTGVSVGVLRKVVALEAAVPLLLIAVISTAMGFLAAGLFLNSQLSESLRVPGSEYFVIVVAGLVASLAIIASTLPLIERITGPEVARNE